MSNIRISICMPVKNFGDFIGQTLQSIIDQAVDGLEIVVLDGGSTDNTQNVVRKYQQIFPKLRYFYQERAMGIDRDLATAIGLASGDYCWLMSADDVLKQGAVSRILQEIDLGLDTYLYNRTECDRDMKPLRDKFWLKEEVCDRIFNFSNRQEMYEYFKAARSLGALFSYISSIVFSRKRWCQVDIDDKVAGTNYQHVSTLFTILKQGGKHKYISKPLVFSRGDNDSFHQKGDSGLVARFLIDIDGYHLLGERLFPDKDLRKAFMMVMQYERQGFMWIRLAIRVQDDTMWANIRLKLLDFGYSSVQLGLISILRRMEFYMPMFSFRRFIRAKMKLEERL